MKQCPTCNRSYRDDTQNFCLEDGTPLTSVFDAQATHLMDPPRAASAIPVTSGAPIPKPARTEKRNDHSASRSVFGKWVFFASTAILIAGMFIVKDGPAAPGIGGTLGLLVLCSGYFMFLTSGKKPLLTCARKAYVNFLTFIACVLWLLWAFGYMDRK